jgi:AraC-like DNA-binding protein
MQVSIAMVSALVGAIERAGGSRERFLSRAGVDARAFEDRTLRLRMVDYVRAIDAALEVSSDPALGLHMGEQARAVMFDVLGPLVEQAATLRQGLQASGRYSRLMAEGHDPELHEDGEHALIRYPVLRGDLPSVRLTAEFAMTATLPMLQQFVGVQAHPTHVDFAYPAPEYVAEYTRIFGSVVRFDQAFTQMEIPRAYLDKTQLYRNPEIYALLETEAERSLGRLERDAPLRERIERVLTSHAPRRLTMDEVARELDMSARSLRRRMQVEGVSFGNLVERNSTLTAKRMLERPGASIQETAYAMGFASPAAFHRAFKRWTGMTPKEYQDSF